MIPLEIPMYRFGSLSKHRFHVILFAVLFRSSLVFAAGDQAADPPPTFAWADEPRPLSELAFADEAGSPLTLADFRGKWVVLNVWATFCIPCLQEMPSLDNLQAKLGGQDFEVIALNEDFGKVERKIELAKNYYAENGLENLKVYVDYNALKKKSYFRLRVGGMPTTILVDPDGRELGRHCGAASWDGDEALEILGNAMAGKLTAAAPDARQLCPDLD